MKGKNKKGFTLIELVIVLAVLAIIALIAIPNFTKVRNDSLEKADQRTCEVIGRVITMEIANGNVNEDTELIYIDFKSGKNINADKPINDIEALKKALNEVKEPQTVGNDGYIVQLNQGTIIKVEATTIPTIPTLPEGE